MDFIFFNFFTSTLSWCKALTFGLVITMHIAIK